MINNSFSSNLTQVHLYASSGLSWSTEDKTSKLENEAEAEAEAKSNEKQESVQTEEKLQEIRNKVEHSTIKSETTTSETSTSVAGSKGSPFSFSANVSGFSDILDYPLGAALNDRAKLALAYARLALAVENGNNLKEEVIGLMGGQPSQTAPAGQSGALVPGNVSSSSDQKPRLHLLLLATWSSGSTFLTKLITHYPGTFLTFEPMVYIKGYGAVEQSRAEDAVSILRSVFMCNYTTGSPANKMLGFLKGSGYKKWPLHNIRLRNICENVATDKKDDLCLSPDFLGKACQLYPTHLVKTVRNVHFVFVKDNLIFQDHYLFQG